MIWLLGAGLVVLALALGGRRGARGGAPSSPAPIPAPPPEAGAAQVTLPVEPGGQGTITPPPGEPGGEVVISEAEIPSDILAVVQQGGTASEAELEAALARARALGRDDLASYFEGRLAARRGASPEGAAPAGRPMRTRVSTQPAELPRAGASREELYSLAQRVTDDIRRSAHRRYDRALLRRFQAAAGIGVDGLYGRQSAQALGHYGRLPAGQVPPAQF